MRLSFVGLALCSPAAVGGVVSGAVGGLALLALLPAVGADTAARQPVRLCGCDPAHAATQEWSWGAAKQSTLGAPSATAPSAIRLKASPERCIFKGGAKPTYLYVDECSAGEPVMLSFVAESNSGMTRDTSVLTNTTQNLCLDADGMTTNLQLYNCELDDNDQQYAAVPGYGLVVDLWTGNHNCMGVDDGKGSCPPPTGAHPPPKPSPPPPPGPPPSIPSTPMSPQYHLNDGPYRQSDPSGCIEINGTWFVFPDGSGNTAGGFSLYTSRDLVHWTRRPTNKGFGETGGIGVTDAGLAVTFGSGFSCTDLKTDPYMANWSQHGNCNTPIAAGGLGDGDPHTAHGLGQKGVFRNVSQVHTSNHSWINRRSSAGMAWINQAPECCFERLRVITCIGRPSAAIQVQVRVVHRPRGINFMHLII